MKRININDHVLYGVRLHVFGIIFCSVNNSVYEFVSDTLEKKLESICESKFFENNN